MFTSKNVFPLVVKVIEVLVTRFAVKVAFSTQLERCSAQREKKETTVRLVFHTKVKPF